MDRSLGRWITPTLLVLSLKNAAAAQPARDVTIAVPQAVRAAAGFDPAESAGIFVGIRDFNDETFAAVPFAVDDAVDLAHLFAFDLALIPPTKIVLSLAGEPQKSTTQAKSLFPQGESQRAKRSCPWRTEPACLLAPEGPDRKARGRTRSAATTCEPRVAELPDPSPCKGEIKHPNASETDPTHGEHPDKSPLSRCLQHQES